MSSILMNSAPGSFSRQQSFKPPPMGASFFGAAAHPSGLGAGGNIHAIQSGKARNQSLYRQNEKGGLVVHQQLKQIGQWGTGFEQSGGNDRRRTSLDLSIPRGPSSGAVQVSLFKDGSRVRVA
jgi:hypothetical protein